MTARVITTVTYQDDLGGAGAAKPLVFSIDGVNHEIHLNKRNMETFLRRLKPYTDVSRPPAVEKAPVRRASKDAAAVRVWAQENGFKLGNRGRISSKIVDAYRASL